MSNSIDKNIETLLEKYYKLNSTNSYVNVFDNYSNIIYTY